MNRRGQILAMALIGVGLMFLGIVSLWWLSRSAAVPDTIQARPDGLSVPAPVHFAAPDLKLTDLQGQPVTLSSYRGQVVLVNNWAIWCPPCKAEMPTLNRYYQDWRHKQFTIIAIEAGEPVNEVAEFARQYRLDFPVWPDVYAQALAAFRNDTLPSSYVIDRSGQVRLTWTGPISRQMLDRYVTPLLEE